MVTRCFDRALARAAEADDALARGEVPGLLHGLPVAHKDLAETAGVRTTYGSPLFAGHVPDFDALVVERMSGAGAISLGKTNTPEFGAGSHTVNPVFGATRNPYDLSRSAGGSSGGAAAALAARMVCLADGSDLGGSLRNPASFCNVVGLRPSPGRVPGGRGDVADTFGVEGPMARTVADVALLLAVLSGPDPRVPFSLDAPAPVLAEPGQVVDLLARDMRGVKVAWSADLGLPVEPGGAGTRWRRPGRCSLTWDARSPTRRRTCPAPTKRFAPGALSVSRRPTPRCCASTATSWAPTWCGTSSVAWS